MRVALVLLLVVLAGCARPDGGGSGPLGAGTPTPPTPTGPPLVFGGTLRDAVTGALLTDASVRVDLAQVLPCGRQGIGWTSWEPTLSNGTWGPLEVNRPRSDDVAFFVHASASGYATNDTFIGPTQARSGITNMTVILHPDADVNGTAPPGTLVALDAPRFPRVEIASAGGTFRFTHARSVDAAFVAATEDPYRSIARAPMTIAVPASDGRGWVLEGSVKGPTGAPLAADVVAWNGTRLWSVARASDTGTFTLPLSPEPASLRIEARTADDRYGGVLALEIQGPPALRETILAKALC